MSILHAGLGNKRDVTAHYVVTEQDNSAVSRCGLLTKILDASLIMDFPQKMKFFLKNECSDYGRKFNKSKQSFACGEHYRMYMQPAGFQDQAFNFTRQKTIHGEQFHTVSGSHCGRLFGKRQAWWAYNLPEFNMADGVKKTPSLACFRQLDCVFQYSYTSFSILQFHSQMFLLCF